MKYKRSSTYIRRNNLSTNRNTLKVLKKVSLVFSSEELSFNLYSDKITLGTNTFNLNKSLSRRIF